MTPDAISRTSLTERYKNILRDMLGDVMKLRSETIQDHSVAIAWLRTIDGEVGYSITKTIHYQRILSYTAALKERKLKHTL